MNNPGNNGYGQNGYPNGGYPYNPYPVREPFITRFLKSEELKGNRRLFFISLLTGLGFLAFLGFSQIYAYIIGGDRTIYEQYTQNPVFQYTADLLYTLFCVGAPFLVVLAVCKITHLYDKDLPLESGYRTVNSVLLVFVGIGLCFCGNVITSLIANYAQAVGVEFSSYESALEGMEIPDSAFGILLFFLRTAIAPAVIEELVFRGIIMQPLRDYGDWFAIITSACLFGLMHGNMTQVPFALIAGIALGYACIVSGSMWTGIIIHLANNSIAAVFSIISEKIGTNAGIVFSTASTYGLIAIGLLALVFFAMRNPNFWVLYKSRYPRMKHKTLTYILAPTTLLAVIILARTTLYDIVGFGT